MSWLRAVKVPVRRSPGLGLLPVRCVEAVCSRVIVGRLVGAGAASSLEGRISLLLLLLGLVVLN